MEEAAVTGQTETQTQDNTLKGNQQRRQVVLQTPAVRIIYAEFPDYNEQFKIKIHEPEWEMMLELNHWVTGRLGSFGFCIERSNGDNHKNYPIEVYQELLPWSCTHLCFHTLASTITQEIRRNQKLKVRMNLGKTIFNQEDKSGEIRQKIMGQIVDLGKLSKNMNTRLVKNRFSGSVPHLALLKIKLYLIEELRFKELNYEKTIFTLYVTHHAPRNNQDSDEDSILNEVNLARKQSIKYVISFIKEKNEQNGSTTYKMQKIRFGYNTKRRIQFLQDFCKLDVNLKVQVERELREVPSEIMLFCQNCVTNLNQNGLHSEFKRLSDVQTDNIKIETIRRKKKCILEGYFEDCIFKASLAKTEINSYVNKQQEVGFWCKNLNFTAGQTPAQDDDTLHNYIINSLRTTLRFYQNLSGICGKIYGFEEQENENFQNGEI